MVPTFIDRGASQSFMGIIHATGGTLALNER